MIVVQKFILHAHLHIKIGPYIRDPRAGMTEDIAFLLQERLEGINLFKRAYIAKN